MSIKFSPLPPTGMADPSQRPSFHAYMVSADWPRDAADALGSYEARAVFLITTTRLSDALCQSANEFFDLGAYTACAKELCDVSLFAGRCAALAMSSAMMPLGDAAQLAGYAARCCSDVAIKAAKTLERGPPRTAGTPADLRRAASAQRKAIGDVREKQAAMHAAFLKLLTAARELDERVTVVGCAR